jgi:hypothetical protein
MVIGIGEHKLALWIALARAVANLRGSRQLNPVWMRFTSY